MHGAHTHNANTRTRPHRIDRFIIACQESAGFTFQQNGPIWWANDCTPTLHPHPPTPNSSQPHFLLPHSSSRHASPLSRIREGTKNMFLSQASCQLFYMSRRNGERTGHSDSRNHSVWILNVLQP